MRVGRQAPEKKRRELTLRSTEMQHVAVLPEHVDLLYARDRLHVQLLQRTL